MSLKQYMPTGYIPWDVYQVTTQHWAPHRGFIVDSPAISQEELTKNMRYAGYVKVVMHHGQTQYDVAILDRLPGGENPIANTTEKFKTFYNGIANTASLIIVSPCKFDSHILSHIDEKKYELTIFYYEQLKIVLPLTPDYSQHLVLDEKEAAQVKESLKCSKLKPILMSDPALTWSGGKSGDIIKIIRNSRNTGVAVDYRQVN